MKHVAQRLSRSLPSTADVAERLVGVLDAVAGPDSQAVVVAHSYGTAVAAQLLRSQSGRIAQLTMIDPIALNMFLPRLLSALYYRLPSSGSVLGDWLM